MPGPANEPVDSNPNLDVRGLEGQIEKDKQDSEEVLRKAEESHNKTEHDKWPPSDEETGPT